VQAAALPRLPAVQYVKDLYATELKIVGKPLNSAGIHAVALKNDLGDFNQTLKALEKKKTVDGLLNKWHLQ